MKATGDEVRGEGNQRVGRVPGSLGSMHREEWGRKDQPQEGKPLFQTGEVEKGDGYIYKNGAVISQDEEVPI